MLILKLPVKSGIADLPINRFVAPLYLVVGKPYSIEEVELTGPKANEVLVEVVATGVCATDAGAAAGHMGVPFPIVLGHEASGIVQEVGEAVTYVQPGDHVVIACCLCGFCDNCLTGKPGSCENIPRLNFGGAMEDGTKRLSKDGKEIGTFFGQSTFATHAVTNEKNLIKIDKDLDLKLFGPLGCGIVTGSATVLEGLKPKAGSTIAIYGCGAVGLSAVMAAKIAGCVKIIAVDINDSRLELAKDRKSTPSQGILGVIGPKRMAYSKTMGLIKYVTQEVNKMLNKTERKDEINGK